MYPNPTKANALPAFVQHVHSYHNVHTSGRDVGHHNQPPPLITSIVTSQFPVSGPQTIPIPASERSSWLVEQPGHAS